MTQRFKLPEWVKAIEGSDHTWDALTPQRKQALREGLSRFHAQTPFVSIVLPVWNEEANIVRTLASFAAMKVPFPAELIVVNNNSTDRTQEILDGLGVKSILEKRQGIAHARLAGLRASSGFYHLCGDGDSLYPPHWISTMVRALQDDLVTCVYANYSFIPTRSGSRISLGVYELFSEALFELRRFRREFLNVRGANFGFRRDLGLSVKGFEMSVTRVFDNETGGVVVYGEDGRMGRKLGEIGRLRLVHDDKARIWTSARRLLKDGSLWTAFTRRIHRETLKLTDYLAGSRRLKHTTDHLPTQS